MQQKNNKNMTDTAKNHKNLIIAGIAIVVVTIIALIIARHSRNNASKVVPVDTTASTTISDSTGTSEKTSTGSLEAWNKTLASYEGRTITFTDDCTANPTMQTQNKGTVLLLVNNTAVSRTITVGTDHYTVGSRHYKTAIFGTTGSIPVGCDGRRDVTTVVVQ